MRHPQGCLEKRANGHFAHYLVFAQFFFFSVLLFKSNAHQNFCKCDAEISRRKRLICLCGCRSRRPHCWCLRRFLSQYWLTRRFHFYNSSEIQTTAMQTAQILHLIANANLSLILLTGFFAIFLVVNQHSTVTKIKMTHIFPVRKYFFLSVIFFSQQYFVFSGRKKFEIVSVNKRTLALNNYFSWNYLISFWQ